MNVYSSIVQNHRAWKEHNLYTDARAGGGFPLHLPIKTKTLARPNMRAVTCTQSAPVHVSNR